MPDKGYVIITARKEVANRDVARAIYELLKVRLADRPDIELTGQFSNHFDLDNE